MPQSKPHDFFDLMARLSDQPTCRHARLEAANLISGGIPYFLGKMHLLSMLKLCHHMGDKKARKVLADAELPTDVQIENLTDADRQRVINALRPFPKDRAVELVS